MTSMIESPLSVFPDWSDVLPGDVQAGAGIAQHVPLPQTLEQRGPGVLLAAQGSRRQSDRGPIDAHQTGRISMVRC